MNLISSCNCYYYYETGYKSPEKNGNCFLSLLSNWVQEACFLVIIIHNVLQEISIIYWSDIILHLKLCSFIYDVKVQSHFFFIFFYQFSKSSLFCFAAAFVVKI